MAETHKESENSNLQLEEIVRTKKSDEDEKFEFKSPPPFSQKWYFYDEFHERIKLLILGKKSKYRSDCLVFLSYFEASCTERPDLGCKYMHFRSLTYDERMKWSSKYGNPIISGPTLGGRRILLKVKEHYREQKWLKNSNTMKVPMKSKFNERAIQIFVSKCIDDEIALLINYIKFLDSRNPLK